MYVILLTGIVLPVPWYVVPVTSYLVSPGCLQPLELLCRRPVTYCIMLACCSFEAVVA